MKITFLQQVKELVEKLNLGNFGYTSNEFDDLSQEFGCNRDTYEYEFIEHYTGPCIERLDDLAASGQHELCKEEHVKARKVFEKDGGFDIIQRNLETEEEKIISVGWESSPGETVPYITRWQIL